MENPKEGYMNSVLLTENIWDNNLPILQRGYILETRAEHDEETNVIAEITAGPSTAENGNIRDDKYTITDQKRVRDCKNY